MGRLIHGAVNSHRKDIKHRFVESGTLLRKVTLGLNPKDEQMRKVNQETQRPAE